MKIGIDIGGSHVSIALIKNNKEIIKKVEKELTLNDKNNIEQVLLDIIVNSINQILSAEKIELNSIEKIGISVPGDTINGKITNAWNLNIKEFDIIKKLKKYFQTEISIRNDGKCAGLCEKKYGSIKEYDDCIFLCIGTGIGCAVFQNGKMLKPQKSTGYEVGHMIIEKNGEKCNCGQRGCFERYASMSTFKRKIIKKLNLSDDLLGNEILDEIIKNREKVKDIIDEYIDDLSIGLINLINIFCPQAITIGGSFVFFKDILLEKLIEKLEKQLNDRVPDIKIATNLNDSGMIGAIL